MSDFPNRIIDILRSCPNGLTSKDLAERLGTTRRNLSSRLSKLAAYGIIGRVRGTVAEHGTNGAIYKAPAHALMCVAARRAPRENPESNDLVTSPLSQIPKVSERPTQR